MTKEDVIRMAQEAGFVQMPETPYGGSKLETFANLVASAERNRTWTQDHWTEYEHAIVAKEREACAKVCDEYAQNSSNPMNFAENCAKSIRARGQA